MNTAKLWIRATRTLGFALLLSGPAWAAPVAESLTSPPRFSPTRDTGADNDGCQKSTPSTIAFSLSSAQATADCAPLSGDQTTPQPPSYQGYRFADPAADSFLQQPTDNRRYSF
jgi:hypothetical protein